MLAIRTNKSNWTTEVLIGQLNDSVVILEVEHMPDYGYEDISDTDAIFKQRVFHGGLGTEVTYMEFCHIRSLLDELGDAAIGAKSIHELEYRKKQRDYITSLELALVDLYERSI